jgi:hypothetical protein
MTWREFNSVLEPPNRAEAMMMHIHHGIEQIVWLLSILALWLTAHPAPPVQQRITFEDMQHWIRTEIETERHICMDWEAQP